MNEPVVFVGANEALRAYELLIANDEVVANEALIALEELTAKDADVANDELTAWDELTANDDVPKNEPVNEPVKDPVLYELVKALKLEVVTNELVLIVVPALRAKDAVNANEELKAFVV